MKNVKAILGMVGVGVLGASLYAGSAQAGDACASFSNGWNNVGVSGGCPFPSGLGSANASSLSGYSNPGVKTVIVDLTANNAINGYYSYARGEGYDGNTPITTCVTAQDSQVDGQTTTVPAGGNCNAMTKHRLVIGWRSNPPR